MLCGGAANTCRGELARVAVMDVSTPAFEGRLLEPGDRVLCMLDGWRQKAPNAEGRRCWTVNNHSAHRAARATSAVSRGALPADQLAPLTRPRTRRPITRLGGFDVWETYGVGDRDNYVECPVLTGFWPNVRVATTPTHSPPTSCG